MRHISGQFDAAVIGAGHAGLEAALALARMGLHTLVLTLNLDSIGLMPCNPAIGGTSKGHLVREIDALGGEMGLAADDTLIQIRMLNTGKGPAVHSLRAQMDKRRYHERMKRALEETQNITLMQGECAALHVKNGRATGIDTTAGAHISCRAVVVCSGVYLKSRILIGEWRQESGPAGLMRAEGLSACLGGLGFTIRRFKTGTPARVHGLSLDYDEMQIQTGDTPIPAFSFLTGERDFPQAPCYLTYTNPQTHAVIVNNLHRSPLYAGVIEGTGARYCPSIEDKVVRFHDKERHQIFIEPEGLFTHEMYVQGMNTSLPADVQEDMLRTIPGLRRCVVLRPGYAIEYDCIDPTALNAYLGARDIEGLYFGGQVNGTSGYEEAAAQGLYAAINAGLYLKNQPPLLLTRADAYIGVLADDLTVKGVDEPYRMMTSRAEYRLLLRQDNADMRLTEIARRTGLISGARYDKMMKKREGVARAQQALARVMPPNAALQAFLGAHGEPAAKTGIPLCDLLKRPGIGYTDLTRLCPTLPPLADDAREQAEIAARYDGYIHKQREQVRRMQALEDLTLHQDIPYRQIKGLRMEARQKLTDRRPHSIGQAARIPGVSPADIAVLLIWRRAHGGEEKAT
ncbi:MAG: tRNA uridine-5-carboxymethylaminomethyl(34) synthesis enzyme MnmG [Clostridiales bacterium]|jgi:tRNA uridine 5-carboxymethylaminomethyl modification enzyme|nr:tRNA uridine-5-carboxymethylaminomethyl(34) synthesis enzyme MnmG [Clostridiales bacterium]